MKVDLAAARNVTIPDVLPVVAEPLRVLFCGINPSLYSAATGWHFARPGNRFWPALHQSGFTDRQLRPAEQAELGGLGLGITNVAPRATARAAELTDAELRDGADRLRALIEERRPGYVAIAGVTAYRTAFGRPRAAIGPQEDRLGTALLWILPNPSGLNAQWTAPRIAGAFRELRVAAGGVSLAWIHRLNAECGGYWLSPPRGVFGCVCPAADGSAACPGVPGPGSGALCLSAWG